MIASQRWTQEDDRRLLEMRTAGKSPAVIAKELKRTEAAVVGRVSVLKWRKSDTEGEDEEGRDV